MPTTASFSSLLRSPKTNAHLLTSDSPFSLFTGGDGDFATADIGGASVSEHVKAKRERKTDGYYFVGDDDGRQSAGKAKKHHRLSSAWLCSESPISSPGAPYVSTACASAKVTIAGSLLAQKQRNSLENKETHSKTKKLTRPPSSSIDD
jgi:hypothetical protein